MQLKETLHSVQQCFNAEIQNLYSIQSAIGKEIEDIRVKQESLSLNYETTSQQLEVLENQVPKLAIQNKEAPYLFMLPDRTEWFSGRESELDNLRSLLQVSKEPKVQISSVCGLGGTGKTSLAAEYAHRWKDDYDGGVLWFSGEDEAAFAQSVEDNVVYFGTSLKASPDSTLVKTLGIITQIQKPWLLVLDEMDEYKLSPNIGMLLSGPWKRRVKASGHILITTRRKPKVLSETIRGFKESESLQLECFNQEDGKLFVFKRTGLTCNEEMSAEAASLVETLGGLPLALEQACAYISNLSCSLSMYLQQYKKYSLELLDEQDASSASLYESRERLAVRTTWLLNFEYIKQSKNGNYAVRFLHACAFFNPTEIQQDLINPGKPPIEDDGYRDYVDTPLGSPHILKLLTDFSLFKKNKGSSLTVHCLVQEVIREKLKSDEEEVLSLVDAISMLSFAFEKCPSPGELLASNINRHQERVSNLATNPSRFYSWRRLCLHAHEVLSIITSFQALDKRILMTETARIVYECSFDFNISGKSVEACQSVNFAYKIIHMVGIPLTKSNLADMFPYEVPLPETVRRYILYSCMAPSEAADSSISDKHKNTGLKSQIDQMHAQGNSYFNNGNFHKAVEMYSSAMAEISTFDPKLFYDRALAYINLKQYENALADSDNYILQRPKCWLGLSMKALALHGLNDIWKASSFAALAFYHNREIFFEYQSFKDTFSTLERQIYICNTSSLLTDYLLTPVSDSQADSKSPGKIIMIEPGDYLVNCGLSIVSMNDCILLGVENLKSSVVIRFNKLCIRSGRHAMAANLSFVFSTGFWKSHSNSITTLLNCSFTSSLEVYYSTFFSLGTDTFRDCSFENCPGLTVHGKTNVERCVFSGSKYSGIDVSTGGRLEIEESKLHGNETGIYIYNAAAACNIANCEIFDNKSYGIFLRDNVLNVRVQNCRIYQNDRDGISVEDESSLSVSNSEIFENRWQGIGTCCNGRCTVLHNKIYANKSWGVQVVPVDTREGMSPSIIEFNDIFDNRGHGLYCEMVIIDKPLDTSVPISKKFSEQLMNYQQNSRHFKKAKCNENNCYNNESEHSLATSKNSRVDVDFCFYCHKKCSSNCAKCFVTTYCNKECQKHDWKKHKKNCPLILESFTVRVNISPSKGLANREHAPFGLVPKGSEHAQIPKSGERFLVKVLVADEMWHENLDGPVFTICDRSLTIDGILDKKCYPQLYNIVQECGVSSTLADGWRKKFFWAILHDEDLRNAEEWKKFFWAKFFDEDQRKLSVFITKFPPHEDW